MGHSPLQATDLAAHLGRLMFLKSPAAWSPTDRPAATHEGTLQSLGVSPLCVQVGVVLIRLQLLVFFLLLVIMRQHRLVCILIDAGLPCWSARALGRQLAHNLGLFV